MNNIKGDGTAEYIEKVVFTLCGDKNQKGADELRMVCKCTCKHSGKPILVILKDSTEYKTLCLGTLEVDKKIPFFLSPGNRFSFSMEEGKYSTCVVPRDCNGVRTCESNIIIPYPFRIPEHLDTHSAVGGCKFSLKIIFGYDEIQNWFINQNRVTPEQDFINIREEMFKWLCSIY